MMRSIITIIFGLLASAASAAPHQPVARQNGADGGRMVFAHFMMGIVQNRKSADAYDEEFALAKSAGIEAFALNMGPDVSNEQLGYAYASAAKIGIKVFISFDFNDGLFKTSDAANVGEIVAAFKDNPGQLLVDGKPFVSTFAGPGLDVTAMESAAGADIFFAPNWYVSSDKRGVDALFNWNGWRSDGNNNPGLISPNNSIFGDGAYVDSIGSKDRYMAPVSPWFSTHYSPDFVPYQKNWVFQSDNLWFERWNQILELSPRFIEIVTWNDFGESAYVGPISAQHDDDGHSKWINDMPHGGWLEMAKPYIAAFKAGDKSPAITEEKLVYWYRPTPKDVVCSGDSLGKPNGWELVTDEVFVVALLMTPGTVTISSGSNTDTFDAPAGASLHKLPLGTGTQKFGLVRGNSEVFSETSLRDVVDSCACGIYNFNAYVGTVPAGPVDELIDNGRIGVGVPEGHECLPKPSLPIRAAGAKVTKAMN